MPIEYSVDLRWRAIWLHLICGKSRHEVVSCQRDRYIALYNTTGTVQETKQRHGPQYLLSDFEQVSILQSLANKPTMYLQELQAELYDLTGTWVHISTICRTVHRLGLTRKKCKELHFNVVSKLKCHCLNQK